MELRATVLVCLINVVLSLNREKFHTFPKPQKKFDVHKYKKYVSPRDLGNAFCQRSVSSSYITYANGNLGQGGGGICAIHDKYVGDWFYVAQLPSCSYSGSSEFTNIVSQYRLQKDGCLDQKVTFRSIACTCVEVTKTPKDYAGIFQSKDSIGNPMTGPSVVVATDYKRFAITWGCTFTVGQSCQDAYLYVKTRRRKPGILTWKLIEAILLFYYDMSLTELKKVVQDKDACVMFKSKPRYSYTPYQLTPLERVKRMYKKERTRTTI